MLALEMLTYAKYAPLSLASQALKSLFLYTFRHRAPKR